MDPSDGDRGREPHDDPDDRGNLRPGHARDEVPHGGRGRGARERQRIRAVRRRHRRIARGGRGDRPAYRRGRHQPQRRIAHRRDARGREELVQVLGPRRFAHGCGRLHALLPQESAASARTAVPRPSACSTSPTRRDERDGLDADHARDGQPAVGGGGAARRPRGERVRLPSHRWSDAGRRPGAVPRPHAVPLGRARHAAVHARRRGHREAARDRRGDARPRRREGNCFESPGLPDRRCRAGQARLAGISRSATVRRTT